MSVEDHRVDKKSLRPFALGKPDWNELAKDCVCFANAQGGRLLIGIEKHDNEPPAGQEVPPELHTEIRRRIGELTVNVTVAVQIHRSLATGGECVEIIVSRSASAASTTDGRYYLRVGDTCRPLVGEEVQRLLNDRNAQPWETLTNLGVAKDRADRTLVSKFAEDIGASDRVKDSVKEKSADELLDHYYMTIDGELTNLGILCVGRSEERVRLGSAPIVQFVKYDNEGRKVNKISWDDHHLTPMLLIDAVWRDVPDFRERYELPDGLFRQHMPVYDERVIRELLVNALVHRPYTQRGDIYLNMYPDRLEVVNPGLLPLGVTPQNVLHQSVRRNNELARVFHDLGLMEREGSGFDLMYEVLLSQGRPVPTLREGSDRVEVVIEKRIIKPEVIDFVARVEAAFGLRQREKIVIGLLAQQEAMNARDLADALKLDDASDVGSWIERLQEWGVVRRAGRTKGTRYYLDPGLLRKLEFPAQTSLSRIEPHRLDALVLEDLRRYPGSAIGDIHSRIGPELKRRQVKSSLDRLRKKGSVRAEGEKRGRLYWTR